MPQFNPVSTNYHPGGQAGDSRRKRFPGVGMLGKVAVPYFSSFINIKGASLMSQWVKNPPAIQELQETWVQPLGREDLLEQEMAPTPVLLPRKSHGQRSLVGYGPWGCKELDTAE